MSLSRSTEKKIKVGLYLTLGCLIFLTTTTISGIWTAFDHDIVNMTSIVEHFKKNVFSLTYIKLSMNFEFPPNAIAWGLPVILVIYLIVPFLLGGVKDEAKYEKKPEYGSHGSARWQTDEEIQRHYYQSKKGIILGDVVSETYYPMDLSEEK
ncbi:hypothetical protein ABHN11_24560 [Brevibacillus centrosporus]|uniref:hypothetical protein n=1 Tax=Brevibacillus centrosporus TaxID=54910 RepID=UPI003D21E09A